MVMTVLFWVLLLSGFSVFLHWLVVAGFWVFDRAEALNIVGRLLIGMFCLGAWFVLIWLQSA
jgi:hypothetical protein